MRPRLARPPTLRRRAGCARAATVSAAADLVGSYGITAADASAVAAGHSINLNGGSNLYGAHPFVLLADPGDGGKASGIYLRSSAAMASLYSDQLSASAVATLHRELFAPMGEGARQPESFANPRDPHKRLRLGQVTANFHHQHPVNIFMQPVLREIDRSRFEVFLYFTGVSHDDQTHLARQRVEHWVEVTTLNNRQLAKRIDADQIDVLLDLAGHTGQQRMSLFAQRAAPVQVTYLGYPGSTGVPNVDWILGDAVVTPQADDALCSERVWRLPGTVFCYAPEADYPYPSWGEMALQRMPKGPYSIAICLVSAWMPPLAAV